jgi:hypothetical protein
MASGFPTGTFTNRAGWTWEFKADGTQFFRSEDQIFGTQFSSGTYTVTGNQVVFKESAGDAAGGCGPAEGIYTWDYDGKTLSFKVLNDRCGGREGTATSGSWMKKP